MGLRFQKYLFGIALAAVLSAGIVIPAYADGFATTPRDNTTPVETSVSATSVDLTATDADSTDVMAAGVITSPLNSDANSDTVQNDSLIGDSVELEYVSAGEGQDSLDELDLIGETTSSSDESDEDLCGEVETAHDGASYGSSCDTETSHDKSTDALAKETASPNDDSSVEDKLDTEDELVLEDQATAAAPVTRIKIAKDIIFSLASSTQDGWVKKGSQYSYLVSGKPIVGWLVTSIAPGAQKVSTQARYWLDSSGTMATSRLISANEAGWWAYAKPEGAVVTSIYKAGNNVYLADSNGKLASPGWLVTDAYSKGTQKRYYIESSTHSARLGLSTSGYAHYTLDDGSVLTSGTHTLGDKVYLADKTGRLPNPGWLVSNAYGQGQQRYYIESDYAAHVGFSTKSYAHYTRPEGYVATSAYRAGNLVYLADNMGKVTTQAGWHTTSAFGQGNQRYWVVSGKNAAQVGFFTLSGKQYYTRPEGYVLRGALQLDKGVLLANNDGVLATATGWLVTKDYASSLERYYLVKVDGHSYAKVGSFNVDGKLYYGLENVGYELRNKTITIKGIEYKANNDGVLTPTKPIVAESATPAVVERYIEWALAIAADDSHGYSQNTRWGPDYDCSSLVISALEAAGLDTGYATYTGNMRSQLTKHGFVWMTDLSAIARGDILLNEVQHTAIYLGNLKMVEATMSETRSIDGKTGDQTGTEITVNPYRNASWDGFLRYSG